MSQNSSVLSYLRKHRKITPRDAIYKLDCYRLSARIYDLRRKGHLIHRVLASGSKKRYAVYTLVKEARK